VAHFPSPKFFGKRGRRPALPSIQHQLPRSLLFPFSLFSPSPSHTPYTYLSPAQTAARSSLLL
jgi:hypothetical protein